MKKFKKTKFLEPYKEDKKGNIKINIPGLSSAKKQKGVYIIREKESKDIYYVGKSNSDLYKTFTRHFQRWNDRRQQRFVYDKFGMEARIIYTNSEKQTNILEELCLKKYKPFDNLDNKLKFIFETDKEYINEVKEAEKNAEIIIPF